MVDVPAWAEELFRAKGIGGVTRAEVVKDTAFHKLVIGYTPTRAVLAEKSLLGSAAYFLPSPAAPLPLAFPPAEEAPSRARPKPRQAKAKAKANRGQVRPRPRKARPEPPDAPAEPAPLAPAPEPLPAPPGPSADLDETRNIKEAADAAAGPHREGDFTLHAREQRGRPFYFFARGTPKSGAPSPMPQGYEVAWNERTKTPYLRKKR